MRKIKLKKRKKFDKLNTVITVIIFLFLSIIITLGYINHKLSPILLDFADMQTVNLANLIINKAVSKQIAEGIDLNKLFSTIQNDAGEIQTIDFNPTIVSKVLSTTTNAVYASLKAIEQGNTDMIGLLDNNLIENDKSKMKKGIIFEIPLGAVSGNAFLSNLGPRIPVKLNMIGSVTSNINTKISQYGINNALIEVFVKIQVTEKINLPLASRDKLVSSDIPIAMKIIEGKIPSYYNNSGVSQSSPIFTLPIK